MSDFIEAALLMARRRHEQHISGEVEFLLSCCQSPIEQKFGVALFATDPGTLCFTAVITKQDKFGQHGFYIHPQMPVRQYRADFGVILHSHYGTYRVVAECDGHQWHEKDKEQAARDKARDRAFLEEGWPTMRFTGSEIHKDAMSCADQVGDFLMQQMLRDHGHIKGTA